ncbi:MAG: hypothetical protein KKC76_13740 [Proteobacteria bacterium]|nr:hypothetical protein [Pseudomonadota bacterium]MBU4297432.1 hypothetical protein [Pseudomonadota bacterium]MCG2746063.1 hypothetical protein [Desulfobulbaceae bacterium]
MQCKPFVNLLAAVCLAGPLMAGCTVQYNKDATVRDVVTPTDATIIEYHVRSYQADLKEFITRLYARNPKYEKDPKRRQMKIDAIFRRGFFAKHLRKGKSSAELLSAAFSPASAGEDRIYLLGQGLVKSIKEAYGLDEIDVFWSGLQVPLERLQRLHFNLSQVNWRLKTYKDQAGNLLFLTNGMGENGYINMGYEVLMTRILTRIEDDISMRGGLANKYMFRMSTIFLTIAL